MIVIKCHKHRKSGHAGNSLSQCVLYNPYIVLYNTLSLGVGLQTTNVLYDEVVLPSTTPPSAIATEPNTAYVTTTLAQNINTDQNAAYGVLPPTV